MVSFDNYRVICLDYGLTKSCPIIEFFIWLAMKETGGIRLWYEMFVIEADGVNFLSSCVPENTIDYDLVTFFLS